MRRLGLIQTLLTRATTLEAEFLTRMMLGEMRIGVVEGVLLDGISKASGIPKETVRRASMLHGDLGDVARLALTQGAAGLESIGLRLFIPVKPMLAQTAENIQEVLAEPVFSSFPHESWGFQQLTLHCQRLRIHCKFCEQKH